MLSSEYLIIVPWAVALLSLVLSNRLWIPLLIFVCSIGYLQERITAWSLLFLAVGFAIAFSIEGIRKKEDSYIIIKEGLSSVSGKAVAMFFLHTCLIVWVLWLFINGIPEVEHVLLLDKVYASVDGIPFTLCLWLDKTAVAFVLAVVIPDLFRGLPIRQQRWQSWLLLALGLLAIQMLACILGLIRPEVKIPSWWWMFALHNLFITCIAEEAFFRGYIQQEVARLWSGGGGLMVASILFGMAHYSGGLIYVCLAGLAGLGYGAALCMTGRLWASIITHFLFNLSHLFLYTYPMLK